MAAETRQVPPVRWEFLRTWKPVLKRARGTPSYPDVRLLVRLWMRSKALERLLDGQNARLYAVARERDALLCERQRKEG